jgi:hypothetical protein
MNRLSELNAFEGAILASAIVLGIVAVGILMGPGR